MYNTLLAIIQLPKVQLKLFNTIQKFISFFQS